MSGQKIAFTYKVERDETSLKWAYEIVKTQERKGRQNDEFMTQRNLFSASMSFMKKIVTREERNRIFFFERAYKEVAILCNKLHSTEAPCRVINRSSPSFQWLQLQYFHNYRSIFRDFRCNSQLFVQFFITLDSFFSGRIVQVLFSHLLLVTFWRVMRWCCSAFCWVETFFLLWIPLTTKQFQFYAFHIFYEYSPHCVA